MNTGCFAAAWIHARALWRCIAALSAVASVLIWASAITDGRASAPSTVWDWAMTACLAIYAAALLLFMWKPDWAILALGADYLAISLLPSNPSFPPLAGEVARSAGGGGHATTFLPAGAAPTLLCLPGLVLALLFAGYLFSLPYAAGGLLATWITQFLPFAFGINSLNPKDIPLLALISMTAVTVGRLVRSLVLWSWERETRRVRQANRHRTEYALALHDAITSELTSALLAAQQGTLSTDSDDDRRQFTLLAQEARKALGNVHDLVRTLAVQEDDRRIRYEETEDDGIPCLTPAEKEEQNREGSPTPISKLVREQDELLRRLGYVGQIIVNGDTDHLPTPAAALLATTLRELAINIPRHCASGSSYTFLVCVDDQAVRVFQTNPYDMGSDSGTALHSGYGLRLLSQVLERSGCSMESSAHDGGWFVSVTIPLR